MLVSIIMGVQHLAYGQIGLDSLPKSTIHIKFGDPIRFNMIEGAELYEFIFSKVVDFDTIQASGSYICDTIKTPSSYIGVSDYGRVLQLFEPYNVVMRYYTNGEWLLSAEKVMVTLYTDSGTDHMIHDMVKAGHMPKTLSMMSTQTRSIPGDMLIEIPVVYHVVVPTWFYGDPREYIPPADIYQNINILNNVFSGLTGELAIDTRIRFRLATTNPIEYCGQNYYGITYNTYSGENNINLDNDNLESPISYPIDLAYRGTYHATDDEDIHLSEYYNLFPSNQYVNIWIFDRIEYEHESVYGLTSSPSLSEGAFPILTIIKDVVRENENLPSRELGYTVAHEMGHLFGLLHAWMELIETVYETPHGIEIVIDTLVDDIDDTRDELGPVLDCDYSNLDQIPYDNIMSYTPDGCRYRFTPLQISHMRNMIPNFFPYGPINETEYHIPSMMGVRFEAPEENWFCSSNSFDIRIHAQPTDRNYIRNFEIEGVEDFNPTFTIEDNDNTRIYHIQLSQPLPEGYYNFILHCGVEDDCVSISKQYFIVECDNNIIDKDNAQWYFDTKVTLDFRNGIAQLGDFSAMDANDSESGICDGVQGEILFYTDGNNIWNSNHELIDEGDEEIVNRGTIVLRLNETKYAVASLNDNGQLVSRLIELNPETHATNITTMPPYQETLYAGITAVPCPTGGYWLISTKQYGNGLDIVSLKMTLDGNSIVYESGIHVFLDNHGAVDRKAVVIKASPDGKYIVCALAEIGLHIFYFNATYGIFSPIDIENCQDDIGGKRPSLAFSPSGRFLYVSDLLEIRQYDMEGDYSCNCTGLHSSVVYKREVEAGEEIMRVDLNLQEGPDGRIYFSRSSDIFANSRKIGVIMEPDNLVLYDNGETICHINDSIIKYPPQTILRNKENLPNLVDAKDVDTCAASFTICSENCSIETLRIHNFSLSPTIMWTLLDLEENVLFTIDGVTEPDLSNYVDRFNNLDAFIIEQSTGCEGSIKRDTVSFNPQLSIVGQDMICLDGRPYTYSVSMEPYSHIASTQWILSGFNGSADYGNGVSNLIITPNANDHEFTITCNVQGQFCKDTATLVVQADTICSFITEFIQKCHYGQIILTNALSDNLSDYEANIIIGHRSEPMTLSQELNSFEFLYRDNSNPDVPGAITLEGLDFEDFNATIVVTNRFTNEVVYEIEVIIPSTHVGIEVQDLIAPALCDNDVSYLSIAVSGEEFVPIPSNYPLIYIGESSNGDLIYHVPVVENTELNGNIIINGAVCEEIIKFPLPYTKRLDTEITAYQTDICTDIGYSTIIIKVELPIELPSVPNNLMPPQYIPYPTHQPLFVGWSDSNIETPLVLSQGSTYIACRYIFEPGTYTPTVHYTGLCSETLEPIEIQNLSSSVPVPIIHDIPSAYVCNSTETTSINIEMDIYDVAEGYVPYAICNGHIYTTERLPETDTYTITINGLIAGNHIATLYYAQSCPIDIPFTIQLVEPEIRDISHTNVCHSGDLATITIEMELSYTEDGFPVVEWNDGETTDFELMSGSNTIYMAVRNDFGVGTYTATIHYTSDCAITLNPITISFVQEPIINVIPPTPAYLCDINETTSITIEMELDYLEDGFVPRAVWFDGETTYFELISGSNTTYRTTLNNIGAGTYVADVYYTSRCYTKSEAFTIQVFEQPVISSISHTNICYDEDLASITIEMELNRTEDGFPIVVWNDGATTNFELLPGSNTTYSATRSDIVPGLYTAEVQYTSYCSMPLDEPVTIAVGNMEVSYSNVSDDNVGIHLNFDPPLSSYTISITENGITTETAITQNPYYFVTNINNDIEITTSCGTIPLNFRVSDVAVNLKSEACLESEADISFEISGGTAPYTATFTSDDITTTQTFNTSGPNVMHAEIIQGAANHLTVVSANGDTYNIDLGTINNISNYAILETTSLGTTYDGGTYIVTSGLTFDHDVTFNGCTIYCTYEDYDDITSTQWTVNVGKTVTFENCTIMAACPDKMWQGIVVNGNEFAAQSATTHATVDIKQNSVIADAIIALKSVYGGIIKANNSEFRNNQYDLYFDKYQNYKHTKTVIRGNKFLTLDGGLNNPNYYPKAHIYMDRVDGISIRSNTFRNENMDADISKWGVGVESSLSGFNLSPRYLTITDPVPVEPRDTFENLYYGVKASGKGTTAPSIKHNVFTGNFRGVYVNNADGARVLFNNFTGIYDRIYPWQVVFTRAINRPIAIHYLDRYSEPYSVYISNSPVSYCEENTITRCEIGAYMSNSGREDISRMYRNKFGRQPEAGRSADIDGATMILGTNSNSNASSQPGQDGLVVSCNEYTGTGSAVDVKGNMRQNQGSENKPAGNKFHSSFVNGMEFNAPNTRENYTYYQTVNATNEIFHTELERYYGTGIRYAGNYDEKNCKSNYGTTIIYDDHLERIDFQGKEVARLKSTYDSIVDRGNTDAMLSQASSVSLFNMVIPFVALCNDGYLSDTVYSTLIANTNSPSAFTAAVLIANSPLPQSVRKMVEDSDLPSIYKSLVGYCQTGINSRDRLKSNINDGKQEIAVLESEMFHEAINNDTVTAVKDTVLTYLRGKSNHTYNDAINEYKLLLSKKDYAAVRDALKGIYGMTSGMDSYLRDELTNFCSVNNIYVDYLTATSDAEAAKILDGNSATLLSAVNDSSPLYSGLAEVLYEKYADGVFLEYTPLPEMAISNKSMIVSEEPDATLFAPYIAIYPNPTDGMVFVEYNFEYSKESGIEFLLEVLGKPHDENCNIGTLNLYSSDSKILHTMQMVQCAGMSVIDLSNYPAGTYIIEVLDCIGNATSVKVVRF